VFLVKGDQRIELSEEEVQLAFNSVFTYWEQKQLRDAPKEVVQALGQLMGKFRKILPENKK
jgi:hypothetical protein